MNRRREAGSGYCSCGRAIRAVKTPSARKPEHGGVDAHPGAAQQVAGGGGDERLDPPHGQQQAERPGRHRQHRALDEQLADQAPAPGAERLADRHLGGATGAAHEQHVGDVAAGDEQHQSHGAEHDPERERHVADELLVERHQGDAVVDVGPGILGLQAGGDGRGLGAGVGERGAGRQSGDPEEEMRAAGHLGDVEGKRDPQLPRGREGEPFRHHADHHVRQTAQRDGAAEDLGIGGEAVPPEGIAENGDAMARPLLVGCEGAAQGRLDAQHREEVVRGLDPDDSLGGPVSRKCQRLVAVAGDLRQCGGLFPPVL
jgi:hypothetical protein